MARYIAAKAGSSLLPTDSLQKVAHFKQVASIETATFDAYTYVIAIERLFKLFRGAQPDEARVQELASAFKAKLAAYMTILSKQKYLAGDKITIADLFHLPYGIMLAPEGFNGLEDTAKFLNVAR